MDTKSLKPNPLPLNFYQGSDVLLLGKELLGKILITSFDGTVRSAIITETESYKGPEDRASHAYNLRRTKRNEIMYAPGGHAYVYLCYGIHPLFNIVTNQADIPHAILIRGIIFDNKKIVGPGNVTKALGINMSHNGHLLVEAPIWLEDSGIIISAIEELPRVGIDYAGEDALLPWRFRASIET